MEAPDGMDERNEPATLAIPFKIIDKMFIAAICSTTLYYYYLH